MDTYLSPEHVRLAEEVRSFSTEVIAPVAREADEADTFPWETVKAMGEQGYLGVPVPRSFGGITSATRSSSKSSPR